MAIACRYGHISINEAMAMPSRDLHEFIDSVISLIGEENTINKD